MSQTNYIDRMNSLNYAPAPTPVPQGEKTPMGRSVPAIVLSCLIAVFLLPIGFFLGIVGIVALYPGTGLDEGGATIAWVLFGVLHGLVICIIAGLFFNRMRNYATNILACGFLLGYLLGIVAVNVAYRIGGPEAFL